jgi:hypothetical protein
MGRTELPASRSAARYARERPAATRPEQAGQSRRVGQAAYPRWEDVYMTDTGLEPEVPEDPESPDGPGEPEDEARVKFREALDRKRAQEAATAGGPAGTGTGKVRETHGPASGRRSFRRRGGG